MVIFNCEIRDRGFYKLDSITITVINDAMVKTKFLQWRRDQNLDKTFDHIFINELDLRTAPITSLIKSRPQMRGTPITAAGGM